MRLLLFVAFLLSELGCRSTMGARTQSQKMAPTPQDLTQVDHHAPTNNFLAGAMNWELVFAETQSSSSGDRCTNISLPDSGVSRQGALVMLPPQDHCPNSLVSLAERLQNEGWTVYIPRLPDEGASAHEWEIFANKINQLFAPEKQQRAMIGIGLGAAFTLAKTYDGTFLVDKVVAISPFAEVKDQVAKQVVQSIISGPIPTTSQTRIQLVAVAGENPLHNEAFATLAANSQENMATAACFFQTDIPQLFWSSPHFNDVSQSKAWLHDAEESVSLFLKRGIFFAEFMQPLSEAGILQCKHRPLNLIRPVPGSYSPGIKKSRPALWLRGGPRPESLDRRQLKSLAGLD